MIDFHILVKTSPAHAFAEGGMFDIVQGGNAFDFAIGDSDGVIKKL